MKESEIMAQVKSLEIRAKDGTIVAVYPKEQLNEARKAIEGNGHVLQYVLHPWKLGEGKTIKKNDRVRVIKRDNWLFDSVMHVSEIVLTDLLTSDSKYRPAYWCKTDSGLADWYLENEITLIEE